MIKECHGEFSWEDGNEERVYLGTLAHSYTSGGLLPAQSTLEVSKLFVAYDRPYAKNFRQVLGYLSGFLLLGGLRNMMIRNPESLSNSLFAINNRASLPDHVRSALSIQLLATS